MSPGFVIRTGRPDERTHLYNLWHASVRATHDFLSEEALAEISVEVKDKFLPNVVPDVIVDAREDKPLGFMVMSGDSIDALFVDASHHGQGLGTLLIEAAKAGRVQLTVEVNEQNPRAWAFYRRCGFVQVDRKPVDDAGRPFPLIVMRWTDSDGSGNEARAAQPKTTRAGVRASRSFIASLAVAFCPLICSRAFDGSATPSSGIAQGAPRGLQAEGRLQVHSTVTPSLLARPP